MLVPNHIFGDFVFSFEEFVDVLADWCVVLEDIRLTDLAVELPPVDFVEVDLLVD